MVNNETITGGAVVFRDNRGKRQWLIVKHNDESDWEIPKITARRGESSVRSVLRMTTEQGGMTTRVLEEAGRGNATLTVGPKTIHQRLYYYLLVQKAGGVDILGFSDYEWQEFPKAVRKLSLKKEKQIFKDAKGVLKEWEKKHKVKKVRS
ncbi:hypothetical protein HY045_03055 [Candidatus Woesebacteria bacterium]|nr:hypothetical protein [Candidatus Woesebacteria bacterium]